MAHVLILAGGMATRLKALTSAVPKCMVPCRGRPFLEYPLAWMSHFGVTRATFVLGHMASPAIAHLERLRIPGIEIDWVIEGEQRLGTGGALDLAFARLSFRDDVLVMYGDSFLAVNFADVLTQARTLRAPALMTVLRNEGQWDTSNVHFEPPRVRRYSKDPAVQSREQFRYIDYGLLYFQTSFFQAQSPRAASWDLSQLLETIAARDQLYGLEVHQRFYEIGTPPAYEEFNRLLEGKIDPKLATMIDSCVQRLNYTEPLA